jgi:hypothetical protein
LKSLKVSKYDRALNKEVEEKLLSGTSESKSKMVTGLTNLLQGKYVEQSNYQGHNELGIPNKAITRETVIAAANLKQYINDKVSDSHVSPPITPGGSPEPYSDSDN